MTRTYTKGIKGRAAKQAIKDELLAKQTIEYEAKDGELIPDEHKELPVLHQSTSLCGPDCHC